ncbi:NUDIX hydrolase [Ancylobacter sonchi]|uniref:NUDIX hydrolase n=1 Tax=Ancylobacter sonchi TaxID=1937790 RepID=UPI001BD29F84|nr:NUDIX hydrolase [Ancylobacter sonchi]MBS7536524.1 NUDIX hydrolase [Ancylobacter sonchi]
MTIWRPVSHIRVLAIGLHWRGGRLLAAEVRDDLGQLKGVRPLGGGVEFGERCEAALMREFREELGVAIEVIDGPAVLENIYTHHGATGHEVVFAYEVDFAADAFAGQDTIVFHEDDGSPVVAHWYDLAELDVAGGPALYPEGLKRQLLARRTGR